MSAHSAQGVSWHLERVNRVRSVGTRVLYMAHVGTYIYTSIEEGKEVSHLNEGRQKQTSKREHCVTGTYYTGKPSSILV